MENELEKAFENKFFCPARFAEEIETLVKDQEDAKFILMRWLFLRTQRY